MSVASSRTNGFLFADLRDYTRYVESHGDRAAAALLEAYRSLAVRLPDSPSVRPWGRCDPRLGLPRTRL
jgi:hypothetical protein